jgi:DNA-binding response OmpR family regulator
VLGVGDSRQRARWLMRGYGDALSWDIGLEELALRAERLLLPPWAAIRRHGRLELDPGKRDVALAGRYLRLHPREFALLWRLSDEPGNAVPRAVLLRDVLGLTIEPRTNALAVHVCRLRKKLHTARLSHLLVTGSGDGSYALMADAEASPLFAWRNPLDGSCFSGEEMALIEEAAE